MKHKPAPPPTPPPFKLTWIKLGPDTELTDLGACGLLVAHKGAMLHLSNAVFDPVRGIQPR